MGPVVALVIAVGNQNHLRYLLYKSGTGDYIMHQPGEEDQDDCGEARGFPAKVF